MGDTVECARLLQSAQQGSRGGFDRLQQAPEPRLRRFLQGLLGASDREDDILRNAFLALYLAPDRLEGEPHLTPFLYRVVCNLAYSELRCQGRYSEEEFDELIIIPSSHHPYMSPDEAVTWILIAAEVDQAMLGLPQV
ncbi:MAG: RNA polymerase sigma factor [Dehalococcoidia bacterium]